jgi:hypothetical protein
VTWLGQLGVYLPARSPEFDPGPFHVGFAFDEVECKKVVLLVLRFSLVGSKLIRFSATKDDAI